MTDKNKDRATLRLLWAGWLDERAKTRHEKALARAKKRAERRAGQAGCMGSIGGMGGALGSARLQACREVARKAAEWGLVAAKAIKEGSILMAQALAALARATRRAVLAIVLVLASAALSGWLWGAAAAGASLAGANGVVWVHWAQWRGQLETTAREAKESKLRAPGEAREASARPAAWNEELWGAKNAPWRALSAETVHWLSVQDIDACFKANACERFQANWGQATLAALTGGAVKWRSMEASTGRAADSRALAELNAASLRETLNRSGASVGAVIAAVFGALSGAMWAITWLRMRGAAREADPKAPANLPWIAATLGLIGQGVVALFCIALCSGLWAGMSALQEPDEFWVAPANTQLARLATQQNAAPAGNAIAWMVESSADIASDFRMQGAADKTTPEGKKAAIETCERLKLCAQIAPFTLRELAMEALRGQEPDTLARFPAGDSRALWAARAQVAKAKELRGVLAGMLGLSAIFSFMIALVFGREARSRATRWQERLSRFAVAGRPAEERRALAVAAGKAAKAARKEREKNRVAASSTGQGELSGGQDGGVEAVKKPPRI
jgi:hypothetical protein